MTSKNVHPLVSQLNAYLLKHLVAQAKARWRKERFWEVVVSVKEIHAGKWLVVYMHSPHGYVAVPVFEEMVTEIDMAMRQTPHYGQICRPQTIFSSEGDCHSFWLPIPPQTKDDFARFVGGSGIPANNSEPM